MNKYKRQIILAVVFAVAAALSILVDSESNTSNTITNNKPTPTQQNKPYSGVTF